MRTDVLLTRMADSMDATVFDDLVIEAANDPAAFPTPELQLFCQVRLFPTLTNPEEAQEESFTPADPYGSLPLPWALTLAGELAGATPVAVPDLFLDAAWGTVLTDLGWTSATLEEYRVSQFTAWKRLAAQDPSLGRRSLVNALIGYHMSYPWLPDQLDQHVENIRTSLANLA